MRLYNSYIIKAILVPLITLALIIISIVWILQTVKLLYLIDKGVAFVEFLKITSLAIPALTFMTLPFVTISAVVYAYYGLTRERQLIILRSLGLSNIQLAYPAIIVSFLVCCFASYLGFYLVPYSYGKLKRELDSAKNHFISSAITPSSFNQIAKNLTIYVGEKLSSNRFNEIILFDHRELKSKPSVIFAKSGYLHKTENGIVLILKHGTKQAFDKEDNFNKLMFGSVSLELKKHLKTDEMSSIYGKDIKEYYINQLLKPDPNLSKIGRAKLISEAHHRIIWSLHNICFTLIGLSVFLSLPYSRKASRTPILWISCVILIISLIHFSVQNLASQQPNFIIGSYANLILSTILALYLYSK